MRPLDEQERGLRAVDPNLPIGQHYGEPDMLAMQLPDGREVVYVVGGYDVWDDNGPVLFDQTVDQIKALIRLVLVPEDGRRRRTAIVPKETP